MSNVINFYQNYILKLPSIILETINIFFFKFKYNLYSSYLNNFNILYKYQFFIFFTKNLFLHNYIYLKPYTSTNSSLTVNLFFYKKLYPLTNEVFGKTGYNFNKLNMFGK